MVIVVVFVVVMFVVVVDMVVRAGLSQNYDTALKDMTRNYEKRSFLKPHRI
jgi:hypothetical protein